jgi:hypothetical protein
MNLTLNRIALFAAICLLCVSTAMAVPACPQTALTPTYVQSTGAGLNPFPPGYVCDIGNLEFSQFQYSSAAIPASAINVQPMNNPGNEGIGFNGALGGNSGTLQDVFVSFTVTGLNGTMLHDLGIDLTNVSTSGTGDVHYTEQFCSTGHGCSIFVDDPTTAFSTDILLSSTPIGGPVSSLNITKDVHISAGSSGSAFVSGFDNHYSNSPVPEPRAISIVLGMGLAAFAFLKRRQAVRS